MYKYSHGNHINGANFGDYLEGIQKYLINTHAYVRLKQSEKDKSYRNNKSDGEIRTDNAV